MVRLTVTDEYGVSTSVVRQITADAASGGTTAPAISLYNSFSLNNTALKKGIPNVDTTISLIDKSYASDGSKNFREYYTIQQASTKKVCTVSGGVLNVGSSTSGVTATLLPETVATYNIQNLPVGTYTVSMYAQTTSGTTVKTETVSRMFTITQAYAVTYNLNGGTGNLPIQYKYNGASLLLSMTQPTREGYTFAGWSTSSAANLGLNNVNYHPGDNYSSNSILNLNAIWLKNETFAGSLKINYKFNYTYSGTGTKEYTGLVEQQIQDGEIVLRRTVSHTGTASTVTDYDAIAIGTGAVQPIEIKEDINGDGTEEVESREYAFNFGNGREYPTVDGEGNAVSYSLVVEDANGADVKEYKLTSTKNAENGQYSLTMDYNPSLFDLDTKIYTNIHNEERTPDKIGIQIYYATSDNAPEEEWKVFPTMVGKVLETTYSSSDKTFNVSYPVWQKISGTEDGNLYGNNYYYQYKNVKYIYMDSESGEETDVYPEDAGYLKNFTYCWDENYSDDTYATGATASVSYDASNTRATGLMTGTLSEAVYQVSYNGNFAADDETHTTPDELKDTYAQYHDKDYVITTVELTSTRYDFVGWNTAADGTGNTYYGDPIKGNNTYKLNADVILYAQWKPKDVSVTTAKDDLDQVLDEILSKIDELSHLSPAEKRAAKDRLQQKADAAKEEIEHAETITDIEKLLDDIAGTGGALQEQFKEEAVADLDKYMEETKAQIESMDDLTAAEKEEAIKELEQQYKYKEQYG